MPRRANERWSLDFVSNGLAEGRKFRTLYIVDNFSREALAIVVDFSRSGVRVAGELDRVVSSRGRQAVIVSDNGTKPTSHAVLKWHKIVLYGEIRIDPNKHWIRNPQRAFARESR